MAISVRIIIWGFQILYEFDVRFSIFNINSLKESLIL